jgi:predicted outer membrane repeat protein
MYGSGGTACVENCTINSNSINNSAMYDHGYNGAGIFSARVQGAEPFGHVIQDCTLIGNSGADYGGAVAGWCSSLKVRRTIMSGNSAIIGGGVAVLSDPSVDTWNFLPTFENDIFRENSASQDGGALYVGAVTGGVSVLNGSFTGHNAGTSAVVSVSNSASILVRNSIIWGNSGPSIQSTNSTVTVEYSCVQGGCSGTGNITNNPLLHPDGYHLLSTSSPCWNTGSTNAPVDDIDGDVRPSSGDVDMGADELADADGDGLPDYSESKYFGNPTNALPSVDSDGDGLTNLQEFQYGTDPTVADTGDSDGDGLADAVERSLGTDPYNPDTDGDGMPDGWEVQYSLNPLSNDALADADGDGSNNLTEWYCGGNPSNADSDADGLSDGDEISGAVMGSPTDPSNPDSDGDGIPDGQDLFPNSPQGDQDGDGIPDSVDSDADNDGIVNSSETYSGNYPSINGLGTFSLYPDSDGDGVPDGVDYDPDDPAVWQNPGSPDIVAPVITVISPLEGVAL